MLEVAIIGTLLGAVYALGAVGFTLLFGVARVLNFSHGALMVMAAYICWWVTDQVGVTVLSVTLSIGLACAVTVAAAQLVNLGGVRPTMRRKDIGVHRRDAIILASTLLAAIVIEEITTLTFSPRPISTAIAIPGKMTVLGTTVLNTRLLVGAIALGLLTAFWYFLTQTRTGIAVTAAAASPKGVAISGISLKRCERIVWIAYGVLTALAGVMTASFIGVSRDSALSLSVTAFAVVVLGGLGSVLGSAVAALILGIAETATSFWISPALSGMPALLIMIITICLLPNGLFGRKVGR